MKICKVFIRNLNSLKGEFTLDFESDPLKECGLFAITGPTGAGKSTILDAITLAVYGRSPRMEKISKGDLEKSGGVLSYGTREACAEVEFICNHKRYLSHWSISVNRNDKLNDYKYTISELPEGKQLNRTRKDTENLIPEITGLSYEQFTRTILLAQGDFARLLEAGSAERYQLMEKITGETLYRELGIQAFNRNKNLILELEKLELKNGSIQVLSEIERQELEIQNSELEIHQQKLKSEIEFRSQEMGIYSEILRIQSELKVLQDIQYQLEIKTSELKPDREKFESWQKILPLSPEYQKLISQEQKYAELVSAFSKITSSRTHLVEAQKKSDYSIAQLFQLSPDTEHFRKDLIQKLQDLQGLLQEQEKEKEKYAEIEKQIIAERNTFISEKSKSDEQEKKLTLIKSELVQIQTWLDEHAHISGAEKEISRLEILAAQIVHAEQKWRDLYIQTQLPLHAEPGNIVREKLNILHAEVAHWSGIIHDHNSAHTESELQSVFSALNLIPQLISISENILRLSAQEKELLDKKSVIEKKLPEYKIVYEEMQVEIQRRETELEGILETQKELNSVRSLDELRKTLQKDHPCPLCGSSHHPGVHAYIEALHTQAMAEKQKRSELEQIRSQFSDLKSQIRLNETELPELCSTIEKIQKEISDLKSEFNLKKSDTFSEYNFNSAAELHDLYSNQNKRYAELQKIQEAFQTLQKLNLQLRDLNYVSELIQQWSQDSENLRSELTYWVPATSEISPEQILKSLKADIQQYAGFVQKASELTQEVSALSGLWEGYKRSLETIAARGKELNTVLSAIQYKIEQFGNLISVYPAVQNPSAYSLELNTRWKEFDTRLADLEERENQLSQEIQAVQKNIADLSALFIHKLKDKNIMSRTEYESLQISDSEAESLARILRSHDESLHQNKIEIESRTRRMTEIMPESGVIPDVEVLQQQLEEKSRERDLVLNRAGSIRTRLQEDAVNRNQQAGLLAEIELFKQKMLPWHDLNDLMGDAKGETFNSFAQKLTLRFMLLQANANLELMSDRYMLSMPLAGEDENSLYVVDAYLGNIRRAADKTLSGGEKFLVSLALALGLSDLSAGKIQISNLFIDEGFGSLDPDTLEKAVGILENLQQRRGRTIGIISHVNELKERILVQVQVEPKNNGSSSMSVVRV